MELFGTLYDFAVSPAGAGVFLALFSMSEALASVPAIKSNSVFQLIASLLGKLARKPAVT